MPNIFTSLAEAFDPMRLNAAAKMLSENQENVAFRESHGGQSFRSMQMDTEALALEQQKKTLEFEATLADRVNANKASLVDVTAKKLEEEKIRLETEKNDRVNRENVKGTEEFAEFHKEFYPLLTPDEALGKYQEAAPVLNTLQAALAEEVISPKQYEAFKILCASSPKSTVAALHSHIEAGNRSALAQEETNIADQFKAELVRVENLKTLEEAQSVVAKYENNTTPEGQKMLKAAIKRIGELKANEEGAKLVDRAIGKTIESFGSDFPNGMDKVAFIEKLREKLGSEGMTTLSRNAEMLGGLDQQKLGDTAYAIYQHHHEKEKIDNSTAAANRQKGVGYAGNPSALLANGKPSVVTGEAEVLTQEAFGGSSSVVKDGVRYFALDGTTDLATVFSDEKGKPMVGLSKRVNKGGVWDLDGGSPRVVPYENLVLDRLFPTRATENQVLRANDTLKQLRKTLDSSTLPKSNKVRLEIMIESLEARRPDFMFQTGKTHYTPYGPMKTLSPSFTYDNEKQEAFLKDIASLHGTMLMFTTPTTEK